MMGREGKQRQVRKRPERGARELDRRGVGEWRRGQGKKRASREGKLCIIKAELNKIFMQIHLSGLKLCSGVALEKDIPSLSLDTVGYKTS